MLELPWAEHCALTVYHGQRSDCPRKPRVVRTAGFAGSGLRLLLSHGSLQLSGVFWVFFANGNVDPVTQISYKYEMLMVKSRESTTPRCTSLYRVAGPRAGRWLLHPLLLEMVSIHSVLNMLSTCWERTIRFCMDKLGAVYPGTLMELGTGNH